MNKIKFPSKYELYEAGGSKLHIKRGETLVSHCGEKLFGGVINGWPVEDGVICKRCLKAWRRSVSVV